MIAASDLALTFSQVASDYSHYQKLVRPGPALTAKGVHLKWYLIYPESLPVTPDDIDAAQAFLRPEIVASRLALKDEIGFVVQHRCAEQLILYVCTWRGNNEVWETLYHRRCAPAARYSVLERENTSPTFCVWVLPAVLHEQRAWSRYLCSQRDAAAQCAYATDQLTGVV